MKKLMNIQNSKYMFLGYRKNYILYEPTFVAFNLKTYGIVSKKIR
jgi:hypothetical protein